MYDIGEDNLLITKYDITYVLRLGDFCISFSVIINVSVMIRNSIVTSSPNATY